MLQRLLRILSHRRSRPEEEAVAYDPEDWLSLDYISERALAKLEAQSDLWDTVDGRLRLILGVIGIVFAAALGLQRGSTLIPGWAGALAIISIACFLVAGVIVAAVYWPTDFDRPPNLSTLRDEYLTTDARKTKLDVIDAIIKAYNKNAQVIARKNRAFKVAFLLTAAATVLLGAAIAVQVACQTTAFWLLPGVGC
jgi:hypothetical protein